MITSTQIRAARAMLGIDQKALADLAGLSLPTIQRMEASDGQVRGVVDSLVKVVQALEGSGIELIGEGATNSGGGPRRALPPVNSLSPAPSPSPATPRAAGPDVPLGISEGGAGCRSAKACSGSVCEW